MKVYAGVDGGGTKTSFVLMDSQGEKLTEYITDGLSYRRYSIQMILERIGKGIEICLSRIQAAPESLMGIGVGLPCYGESRQLDKAVNKAAGQRWDRIPVYIFNDVIAGWAGAFMGDEGIHVVAGTGSIAYGRNKQGKEKRCGGWSEFFGDEGSCFWLGKKMMQLFSWQADGRMEKGPLYWIIKEKFSIEKDFDFIDLMLKNYIPFREKTAALQLVLLEAAQSGDPGALHLYERAAEELVRMADAIQKELFAERRFHVSYSGSLFKAEFLLEKFMEQIGKAGGSVQKPKLEPAMGAAWMIRQKDFKNRLEMEVTDK